MQNGTPECKPERESQVLEQLRRLCHASDRAEALQAAIRDRLASVLTKQVPPKKGEGVAKDEAELVHIASSIRAAVDRINSMSDEYDAIMGRIEL